MFGSEASIDFLRNERGLPPQPVCWTGEEMDEWFDGDWDARAEFMEDVRDRRIAELEQEVEALRARLE